MKIQLSSLDVGQNLFIGGPVDWGFSGDQHEQDDSQAPDVAAFVIGPLEDLRRHVVGCAYEQSLAFFLDDFFPEVLFPFEAESEIDEHDVEALG